MRAHAPPNLCIIDDVVIDAESYAPRISQTADVTMLIESYQAIL